MVKLSHAGYSEGGTVYLWCGCFYRMAESMHREGWRYRCWRHRLLAWLRLLPRGPEGGM